MSTYRAIVEISGRDPFNVRKHCEECCNAWLMGEPAGADEDTLERLGQYLLGRYLSTIDDRTTGADCLSVTVVREEPILTNQQKANP